MADNLVIVESPAKAKTIEKYLGSDYKVASSFGQDIKLLIKTPNINPNIKKRLSLANENKMIKRMICAIFLVSEKSAKNVKLKSVNTVSYTHLTLPTTPYV